MKRTLMLLPALAGALLLGPVGQAQRTDPGGLSIKQRGNIVFSALEASPVNAAALRAALRDVAHVEAGFQSGPLPKWVDGARVVNGHIRLKKVVTLNRLEGGDAPAEWVA
ncbi:unnamed protein product, partial [marine sediment metagenome]